MAVGSAVQGQNERERLRARNLETYGTRIKQFRKRAGMTAEALAEQMQVSKSSVRNWECGVSRPDPEYLYRLFSVLDVEPNEFFGLDGVGGLLSREERQLLEDFRALDNRGREDLSACAALLRQNAHLRQLRELYRSMRSVPCWERRVAAGPGEDWPEYPEDAPLLLRDGPLVAQADEIFLVSGESMEPQFQDRDRVLVRYCTELRNGDVGIFYVPGRGGVIKQKAYDRLHSLNPDYDDIVPFADGARIIGRVLGRVTERMLPSPEEQRRYREAEKQFREEGTR